MILVFGDGLLGRWLCVKHSKDTIGLSHKEIDITDSFSVEQALYAYHPDVVINAAGVVKSATNKSTMVEVNLAPNDIASACDVMGVRLIQVSTDCVFKGDRGNYTENDEPDCTDLYGISKLAGEVTYSPHLTVRTSFVGWPDRSMRGLLADFSVTSKIKYPGYINWLWNGLTVTALADHLVELAYGYQTGLMHLYAQTVTKYDVLKTFYDVFELSKKGYHAPVPTEADQSINRTLSSVRHDQPIIPGTINLEESMRGMFAWQKKYEAYQS